MATAEQIKSLIRSHSAGDAERFYTIALQVAAHEARRGHGSLSTEIKSIVDAARHSQQARVIDFPQESSGLVLAQKPSIPLSSLVLGQKLSDRIGRVVLEYRQRDKLHSYGLSQRRKLLLIGPPGTGKTMTAFALAHETRLTFFTIQVDKLVTKFMGETSAKLRQIFNHIARASGVYLFDEFDSIGGARTLDNDVGEIRRVLSSFLQFIEQDNSESIIVAATNTPELLDRALYRRFDDVLRYGLPEEHDRRRLVEQVIGQFLPSCFSWDRVIKASHGLSHAEIDLACKDAVKQAILLNQERVSDSLVHQMLVERREGDTRPEG